MIGDTAFVLVARARGAWPYLIALGKRLGVSLCPRFQVTIVIVIGL